jgi:hypothetical protein
VEILAHLILNIAQGSITLAVELFGLVSGRLGVASMGRCFTDAPGEVLSGAVRVETAVFAHLEDKVAGPLSVNMLGLPVTILMQFYLRTVAVGTDNVSFRGWTINVAIDDTSYIGYTSHGVRLSRR